VCLSHFIGISSHRITDDIIIVAIILGSSSGIWVCHRRAAASLKHTRRDACHCVPAPASGQLGRAPEHIRYCGLPPAAFLASDVTYGTYFRGARRRIPHALSHGHRQPSCTIYENKRAPPSGHAWHPPGWRQPRVSCSALSPFACFRGGRCVPGDRTRPLSRVYIAASTWQI
jgi:hypothetical protein